MKNNPYKKDPHTVLNRVKQYWKSMMHSVQEKLSRGAQNINRMISHARKENWRRMEKKKHSKD